jgi:hypothetical protein
LASTTGTASAVRKPDSAAPEQPVPSGPARWTVPQERAQASSWQEPAVVAGKARQRAQDSDHGGDVDVLVSTPRTTPAGSAGGCSVAASCGMLGAVVRLLDQIRRRMADAGPGGRSGL